MEVIKLAGSFLDRLFRPAAEIVYQTHLAARLACKASIAAVQDEPVMRMRHEFGRYDLLKAKFDLERRLAWCQSRPIGYSEHVSVDCKRVLAIGHVEHDVSSLAPCSGKLLDFGARARHLAAEILDQLVRERNHVLGLVAIQPNRLDVVAQAIFTEREHLLRRVRDFEQLPRCLVHAGIGCLRREYDSYEERVRVQMFQL